MKALPLEYLYHTVYAVHKVHAKKPCKNCETFKELGKKVVQLKIIQNSHSKTIVPIQVATATANIIAINGTLHLWLTNCILYGLASGEQKIFWIAGKTSSWSNKI